MTPLEWTLTALVAIVLIFIVVYLIRVHHAPLSKLKPAKPVCKKGLMC